MVSGYKFWLWVRACVIGIFVSLLFIMEKKLRPIFKGKKWLTLNTIKFTLVHFPFFFLVLIHEVNQPSHQTKWPCTWYHYLSKSTDALCQGTETKLGRGEEAISHCIAHTLQEAVRTLNACHKVKKKRFLILEVNNFCTPECVCISRSLFREAAVVLCSVPKTRPWLSSLYILPDV